MPNKKYSINEITPYIVYIINKDFICKLCMYMHAFEK